MRAYQVQIKEEYLEDLYQYDAGSIEQEIFSRAQAGLLCIVTDKPETIFAKLGDAVKAVTYMGPMVDLPDWLERHANHRVEDKRTRRPESEDIVPTRGLRDEILIRLGEFLQNTGKVVAKAGKVTARAGASVASSLLRRTGSLVRKMKSMRSSRSLKAGHGRL